MDKGLFMPNEFSLSWVWSFPVYSIDMARCLDTSEVLRYVKVPTVEHLILCFAGVGLNFYNYFICLFRQFRGLKHHTMS